MSKKKPPKEMSCEKCGIPIRYPNKRFCNQHRQTQKERMDEIKAQVDKRCPMCGVQISHVTTTCWTCRPHSVKGKKIVRKPKPIKIPKADEPQLVYRRDNDPNTDDEIRAFANRATDRIMAKLCTNTNQIKYQLRQAKIEAGIAKTQFIVPTAEQIERLKSRRNYRPRSEMSLGEPNYQTI